MVKLLYNEKNLNLLDSSVLENFHIAQTFKILLKPDTNIMCNFSPEEFRICRRRMIEGILATDMAFHAKHIGTIKTKVETYEISKGNNLDKMFYDANLSKMYENQQAVLNLCLHAADISNPAKPYKITDQWSSMVYGEFFAQGDKEKLAGLPVSLLCDRETTNVNKSQLGFINFVVAPTFEVVAQFFPELMIYNDFLKINARRSEALIREEEKLKLDNEGNNK
jgi:cAMP-specific phosphodiesterase 4